MPTPFSFSDNGLLTPTYLPLGSLTRGSAPGVNNPGLWSAVAPNQSIESAGDVDVFAITLIAGQRYNFDIDGGAGDASGGSVDIEIDLIDSRGSLVLSSDNSTSLDPGSSSAFDPNLTIEVGRTGTYYIAVHAASTSYVDDFFGFVPGRTGVGDYSLVVSTPNLVTAVELTNGSDTRGYTDFRQNVRALGGNDVVFLAGGNDLASGGTGNDSLYGGAGDDELNGGAGNDRLDGGTGQDVLVGADGNDAFFGGDGNDALNGLVGNDVLVGGTGNDSVWGGVGVDSIGAGTGDDFIRGGAGADTLVGAAGADTFHFLRGESPFSAGGAEDRIFDFETADAIDLSDLVTGALAWRGTAGFTGANQVRVADYRDANGNGFQEVRVNLDGNLQTVELAFFVDVTTNRALFSGDFLL